MSGRLNNGSPVGDAKASPAALTERSLLHVRAALLSWCVFADSMKMCCSSGLSRLEFCEVR